MDTTRADNEISFTLNDLNNLVGMAHLMDEVRSIKFICKRHHGEVFVEGTSGIYKIEIIGSGSLTSNKVYLFNLKKAREFIKKLTALYNDGEGKVLLKLEYDNIQVLTPSLCNLKLEEEYSWLGD